MKVGFLFYQTGNKANGGVNSLMEVISNLEKVTPIIITNRRSIATEKLENSGISVQIINWAEGKRFKIVWGFFPFCLRLFFWLRASATSVVHVNDIQTLLISIPVLLVTKTKIVFNIRGVKKQGAKYDHKWLLVNACDDIIVLSASMKKELLHRLPLKNKSYWKDHIHAIYSIINFNTFDTSAKNFNKNKAEKMDLLYPAVFSELKNQLSFIKHALPHLAARGFRINFVGDFENVYGAKCQKKVNKLGLEKNALFHGYQKDMSNWYKQCAITLILSKREGLARCMIESLACGIPVISFDVTSSHEILDTYDCGIVVPQGDYNQVIKEITKLKNNRNKVQKMGENGAAVAQKNFQPTSIVYNYEKVYRGLGTTQNG